MKLIRGARGEALFSPCMRYRYWLHRAWGPGPVLACCGLNPSTADQDEDDPTIRRVVDYARQWGYGHLVMLNLFAWRSTDRSVLAKLPDPVGAENDRALIVTARRARAVLCAWGNDGRINGRGQEVAALLPAGKLICLKLTAQGQPIHPLYQPRLARPIPYIATSA